MANKDVILGSGKIYLMPYVDGSLPTDALIEIEANELGEVKGGATVSYKPTVKQVKNDLGTFSKSFVTSEEASLKSGVMTWNLATLKSLATGGKVAVVGTKETFRIGGQNTEFEKYIARFVHKYADGRTLRCTVVGYNHDGFELAFDPEEETVIDFEIKAESMDSTGCLVSIEIETPLP